MRNTHVRSICFLLLAGTTAGIFRLGLNHAAETPATGPKPKPPEDPHPAELAALRAEVEVLKGKAPDQSHAMKDVGYHFANLWFAGQKQNWPLAKFYLDETRSHLRWAVRIIPVRKTKAGDLDLKGILDAVDNTLLSSIQNSITAQDTNQFTATYKQALEGCYSCHKASEKPYLRLQIPEQPEAGIMNFDPQAKWPQ